MAYDPETHHRRSIRLPGHDYSAGGAYFVTTCVHRGACLFGKVVEHEMQPSAAGRKVEETWLNLPMRFRQAVFDAFQVMPNHLHGVIVIPGPGLEPSLATRTGAPIIQPYVGPGQGPDVGPGLAPACHKAAPRSGPTRRVGLGDIMGAFKSLSAIAVNRLLGRKGKPLWQEDYFEHIIRDAEELETIRDYILHNPARWPEDPENPDL